MQEFAKIVWNRLEHLLYFIFVKLLHLSFLDKNWAGFMQFVKFGMVGLSNTLLSYILNVMVLLILMPFSVSWDFFAGNIVGFVLSVLWSFYWNNRLVFTVKDGEHRSMWKALLKTYLSYGFTGIILSNVLSWVWITQLGISKFIAPVINLLFSVPINFVMNKLWAFK